MTPYTKNSFGATWDAGNAVTMDARIRFDYQQAAMWHSFKIATVGEMEIADVMPEAKQAGQQ